MRAAAPISYVQLNLRAAECRCRLQPSHPSNPVSGRPSACLHAAAIRDMLYRRKVDFDMRADPDARGDGLLLARWATPLVHP